MLSYYDTCYKYCQQRGFANRDASDVLQLWEPIFYIRLRFYVYHDDNIKGLFIVTETSK